MLSLARASSCLDSVLVHHESHHAQPAGNHDFSFLYLCSPYDRAASPFLVYQGCAKIRRVGRGGVSYKFRLKRQEASTPPRPLALFSRLLKPTFVPLSWFSFQTFSSLPKRTNSSVFDRSLQPAVTHHTLLSSRWFGDIERERRFCIVDHNLQLVSYARETEVRTKSWLYLSLFPFGIRITDLTCLFRLDAWICVCVLSSH